MMIATEELLLETWPDQVGLRLGTGFMRFKSNYGIWGLCIVDDDSIELLAVDAEEAGKGQFRSFIAALKNRFKMIQVIAITNPIVESALRRYGFAPTTVIGFDGVTCDGLKWIKPPAVE